MKGAFTLALYVAIGITVSAYGQSPAGGRPPLVEDRPPRAVTTTKERFGPPGPWIDYQSTEAFKPTPVPQDAPPPAEPVVMTFGAGGRIVEHRMTFEGYFRSGTKVELRGPCYSACTLLLGYLEKANLCIAPGAFMACHAVRVEKLKDYKVGATRAMYETFPPEVRRWIDDNGGWHNLPLDGFWTMYDRDLWAMGYPRCK